RPWFQSNGRIETATVVDAVPFGHASEAAYISLVQVSYSEGDPETYHLPLAYAAGGRADQVQSALPHALVARLLVRGDSAAGSEGTNGLIYDPTGARNFSRSIVDAIIRRRRFNRAGGEIFAFSTRLLRRLLSPTEPLPEATPLKTPQSNTSVVFGDRLILKVFRHIEDGINPELEVGRFLAEKTSFTHVPPLAGALEYQSGKGKLICLAVLHGFVPNQGDAWHLTHDHLSRYFEHVLAGQVSVGDLAMPAQPIWDQVEGELPAQVPEVIGSFLESVR